MPCFGGLTPFPKRLGGGRPRAKAILESLNASRGTGLDTSSTSPVYAENIANARAIAAAWSTNQRLANIWDSRRVTGTSITRWEKIRAIVPNYGDSDNTRRARLAAIEALAGVNPTHAYLDTLLSEALGSFYESLEYISVANAIVHVPDGSYPFGAPGIGLSWSSTVAHLLIRLQVPTGATEGQFYEAAGRAFSLLDPVVPAWVTIDWYRPGPISTAISGGPSAAGFYLDDEHNLDNEVFDLDAPLIESVSPSSGYTTGGTTVVLGGVDFSSASSVTVAGGAVSYAIDSPNRITLTTNVGTAGAVDIVVTTPLGSYTLTGGFTYIQAPLTLTSLTPNTGPNTGGTAFVIAGTGLNAVTDVNINGFTLAVWTIVDDNTITATTDAVGGPGVYACVVTNGVTSPSLPFTFT